MRTLTPEAAAALASGAVQMAVLVEMDLTQPVRLCSGGMDLVVNGTTYMRTLGLGTIGAVTESPGDIKGLSFTMSGVPSTSIGLALTEPVRGKAVRLLLAVFDPATGVALDVRRRWSGWLDSMALEASTSSWTISVTAEHGAVDLIRPRSAYWSDADQRARYGNDPSLQFMADQVEQRITWPARSFFMQQ